MKQRLLRLFSLCVVVLATFFSTPHSASAANDLLRASDCRINSGLVTWGGSAVLHQNGLVYISRSVADWSVLTTKAYIYIYAIDPNKIVEGTCNVVAVYTDIEDNYTAFSALYNPAVAVRDDDGNVYVGKGSNGYFRLLMIPNDTPANDPFQGILKRRISGGAGKQFYTGTSLAVTSTHLAMAQSAWNGGDPVSARYTVVPISTIRSTTNISSTWRGFDGKNYDAMLGMPNGQFLLLGDRAAGNIWAVFYDPVTQTEKNPLNPSMNGAGSLGCTGVSPIYGCQTPTAVVGDDGNIYVAVLAVQRAGSGRVTSLWKYDTSTNTWSGLSGATPTILPPIAGFENLFGGAGLLVDENGSIATAIGAGFSTPSGSPGGFTTIGLLYNGNWSTKIAPSTGAAMFGRPNLLTAEVNGQMRLLVIYGRQGTPSGHGIYIATYGTPLKGQSSKCKPNLGIEGGALFVNTTTVGGVVYTKATCIATKYYAVASASATPPASVNVADLKPFSSADGTIQVTGLTPNAPNYIHVQLYDATDSRVDNWVTTSVFVDTGATVGATASLSNTSTAPYYLDSYSMGGSTYTAAGHTRSTTGILKITGVTDVSGLNTYAVDSGNAVTYLPSMLNQSIPVSLNAITSTVGISLTLTDGAKNTETRGMRSLVMDSTPPVVSSNPTLTFTPSSAGSFAGTLSLSGGSVTDAIYNATANKAYWGIWVANAVQSGSCPADTSTDLRWGAVPIDSASPSVSWNLLNGLKSPVASGTYCTYVRFLDGAGNASTTAIQTTTTVSINKNTSFVPVVFGQR